MPHKLYQLTRSTFKLPLLSDRETREVDTLNADNIPLVFWPNGRWCLPANIWMLELFEKGHSRRGLGGTLSTYAANISHLLRFCYVRGIDIHEITDGQFTSFIKELREEIRGPAGPRVRDDNSVLAIGRNCLELINSVGEFRQDSGLIGKEGRVRGYKRVSRWRGTTPRRNQTDDELGYWHHNCFPRGDPLKRRFPITADAINSLKEAVLSTTKSIFRRKRRYEMLRVLEITGGRRIEVALLKVESVLAALESPTNELKILTAKRRGGKADYRFVPVSKTDLEGLIEYITVNRQRIIRKTLGVSNDHGYVFVNERTGQPLRPNTVTLEISVLAKHAKLPGVTCPHMFRHRFVTKIFVKLIKEHDFEHKDDLRRALIVTKNLMQQLQQWTGHRNINSLERYIDMAFEEVIGFRSSVKQLRESMEVDAIQAAMTQLALEMKNGDVLDGALRLEVLAKALEKVGQQPHIGSPE